jgi:uncharacterized protein
MPGLLIDVADLLTHPGARREVTREAVLEGLAGSAAEIDGPVRVDLSLERVSEGIVARGTVAGHWHAECSTCLRDVGRDLAVHVDELFEPHPVEGETYPLHGHELDLEQLVRDALLLELPLAPHCEEPCAPAGDDRAAADDDDRDPRWAPLTQLEL